MTNQPSISYLLWRMIRYAFGLYLIDTFLWMFIMGLPAVPGLIIREFFNTLTSGGGDRFTLPSQAGRLAGCASAVARCDRLFSFQSPLVWVALLLAIGIARIGAIFLGRITKTQHRFTMSSLLQRNLLEQLFQRPGAEPFIVEGKTVSPGEVISFFRDDAAQIEDNVAGTNEILGSGIFAIVSLIILLTVNARFTLLVFLPLVAIALAIQFLETHIKRYRAASRQSTQQVTGLIGEMFASIQAIQVAGAEPAILKHLHGLSEQRRQRMVRDQVFTAVLQSSLENLVSLGTGIILLVAAQSGFAGGGFAVAEGDRTLNIGDFALFVYYLAFVTDFLGILGSFLTLTKQTEVSFERMETLVDNREDLVKPTPLYLPDLRGRIAESPAIAQPDRRTALNQLKAINLTYQYPGSDRGIASINLTLKRGSLTVITGRVGSGKTTLLQVLLGLLPMQSGEIYWNSLYVDHPDQFFVPPHSAYTPQVPQLFSTTLQENLLLGWQASEEQMQRAIDRAVLGRDLTTMPEGLDTLIGAQGMRLSGGQQQRTAAARMLIRQPELLVVDDLSSALDVETEQKLWLRLFALKNSASLLDLPGDRSHFYTPTFLVVSHRPFVLRQADRIIVMQNGCIEAEGEPEDFNFL